MRSTLLASCLLVLSFGVVGCDDGMKKADTAPAPTVSPAPAEPGKGGAMEGPASGKTEGAATPATSEPAPATTPAPATDEPKKDAMPKS